MIWCIHWEEIFDYHRTCCWGSVALKTNANTIIEQIEKHAGLGAPNCVYILVQASESMVDKAISAWTAGGRVLSDRVVVYCMGAVGDHEYVEKTLQLIGRNQILGHVCLYQDSDSTRAKRISEVCRSGGAYSPPSFLPRSGTGEHSIHGLELMNVGVTGYPKE